MISLVAIRERQNLFVVEVRRKYIKFRRDTARITRIASFVLLTAFIPFVFWFVSVSLVSGMCLHTSDITAGVNEVAERIGMNEVAERINAYVLIGRLSGGLIAIFIGAPCAYKFFTEDSSIRTWAFWKEVIPVRDGEFEERGTCGVCYVVATKEKWKHKNGDGCSFHLCEPCVTKWLNSSRKTRCPQCHDEYQLVAAP